MGVSDSHVVLLMLAETNFNIHTCVKVKVEVGMLHQLNFLKISIDLVFGFVADKQKASSPGVKESAAVKRTPSTKSNPQSPDSINGDIGIILCVCVCVCVCVREREHYDQVLSMEILVHSCVCVCLCVRACVCVDESTISIQQCIVLLVLASK